MPRPALDLRRGQGRSGRDQGGQRHDDKPTSPTTWARSNAPGAGARGKLRACEMSRSCCSRRSGGRRGRRRVRGFPAVLRAGAGRSAPRAAWRPRAMPDLDLDGLSGIFVAGSPFDAERTHEVRRPGPGRGRDVSAARRALSPVTCRSSAPATASARSVCTERVHRHDVRRTDRGRADLAHRRRIGRPAAGRASRQRSTRSSATRSVPCAPAPPRRLLASSPACPVQCSASDATSMRPSSTTSWTSRASWFEHLAYAESRTSRRRSSRMSSPRVRVDADVSVPPRILEAFVGAVPATDAATMPTRPRRRCASVRRDSDRR